MVVFLFFIHIFSYDTYVGYGGGRFPVAPDINNFVHVSNSIFQSFHSTLSESGGAIYVSNSMFTINFEYLGFADCSTINQNSGAFFILGSIINISHVCGYMCEAINSDYQFFSTQSDLQNEYCDISYLTVSLCGMSNRGNSAFAITGFTNYQITNINSSYNFNRFNTHSYGSCFRTYNVKTYKVSYFNFAHSTGFDICNTHYAPNGMLFIGNIFNCSSDFVFKFRGKNSINNAFIGLMDSSGEYDFKTGGNAGDSSHSLSINNCFFDVMPTHDSYVTLNNCNAKIPFATDPIIGHEGLDNCPVPSRFFTNSQYFSNSAVFTDSDKFPTIPFSPSSQFTSSSAFSPSSVFSKSNTYSPSVAFTRSNSFSPSVQFSRSNSFSPSIKFTRSNTYSPSVAFTRSNSFSPSIEFSMSSSFSPSDNSLRSKSFSPSNKFTRSILFSPSERGLETANQTDPFTPSGYFTPSFTFSPNATKYPDGLGAYRADVSGKHESKEASPAAIGATAGISVVFIAVAIVLMLLYLRSKQRQLKHQFDDLSDTFLRESTESDTSSYSYSYYTYEYTYSYGNNEEEEVEEESYKKEYSRDGSLASYYSYQSYSDFDPDYVS